MDNQKNTDSSCSCTPGPDAGPCCEQGTHEWCIAVFIGYPVVLPDE